MPSWNSQKNFKIKSSTSKFFLDVGEKTIGVAASDELGLTAQGIEVIRRTSPQRDFGRLGELIAAYEVGTVVVGLPKNMNGTIGPRAESVQAFAAELDRFAPGGERK